MFFWRGRSRGHNSPIAGRDIYSNMPLGEVLFEAGKRDREIDWLRRSRRMWIAVTVLSWVFSSFAIVGSLGMRESLAQARQQPLAANPHENSLKCERGKWITQLGSWSPAGERSDARLVFSSLQVVQKRAQEHGVRFSLSYTSPDNNDCSVVPSPFYYLWSGPYATAKAAKQVCNQLGWKAASDVGSCLGRTIDKDHKGKKQIRPDGVFW